MKRHFALLFPALLATAILGAARLYAAGSEIADAAMKHDGAQVRSLIERKADVNAPQVDGTTALHWAVQADDSAMADLLIGAGAKVAARTREGVLPMQLAALNGSAAMLEKLLKA
jgi:ankyrin repeat protein